MIMPYASWVLPPLKRLNHSSSVMSVLYLLLNRCETRSTRTPKLVSRATSLTRKLKRENLLYRTITARIANEMSDRYIPVVPPLRNCCCHCLKVIPEGMFSPRFTVFFIIGLIRSAVRYIRDPICVNIIKDVYRICPDPGIA